MVSTFSDNDITQNIKKAASRDLLFPRFLLVVPRKQRAELKKKTFSNSESLSSELGSSTIFII